MSEPESNKQGSENVTEEEPEQPSAEPAADATVDTPVKPEPGSEPPPAEAPAEAKPNFFQRTGQWLFNPESKFGRFNRAFLRGLGWFAASFLVGFLVAFFVLYQPQKAELQRANDTIAELQAQVENVNGQLQSANDEIGKLQDDLTQTNADLSQQTLRAGILAALSQVNTARVALVERDGVAAKTAIQAATAALGEVEAELRALDAAAAESALSRLSLVENELARDPDTAKKDLEILSDVLGALAAGME